MDDVLGGRADAELLYEMRIEQQAISDHRA